MLQPSNATLTLNVQIPAINNNHNSSSSQTTTIAPIPTSSRTTAAPTHNIMA